MLHRDTGIQLTDRVRFECGGRRAADDLSKKSSVCIYTAVRALKLCSNKQ